MKKLILCEGKTDAILLSYYLNRRRGWQKKDGRYKDPLFKVPVRNKENEYAWWYSQGEDTLLIWGVGGKDNFSYAIAQILELQKRLGTDEGFTKVAVLHDRDQAVNEQEICTQIQQCFAQQASALVLENNQWSKHSYVNGFGDEGMIEILPVIIPFERTGALETFLVDALRKNDEADQQMVDQCREFIKNFKSEKYLQTERLRVKSELSTVFAIMSPEKVFDFISTLLESIPWEEYSEIQNGFKKLEEI